MENEIVGQPSTSEKAHFTPAGRGRAPNSFKNRNKPREPRKDSGGAKPTHPDTVCFNCNKRVTRHRSADLPSVKKMIAAAENEVKTQRHLALVVTNLAATAAVPAATMTRRPVKIIHSKFTKRSNFH